MALTLANLAATLLLQAIHAAAESILPCDPNIPEPCPDEKQFCNETSHQCVCDDGYTLVGTECIRPSGDSGGHAGTIAVAVIFTLALLIGGLILVVRKYKLVEYVRQKVNLRRGTDIMYEDVMIGQDDPPLSP